MFEKLSQIAERAATNVSRREFLGRLGRGAMTLAAAVGGLLAVTSEAQAATACGANSHAACRGKVAGQWCPMGTFSGICASAPNCICVGNPPPRYCPRGTCRCRSGACRKQCC